MSGLYWKTIGNRASVPNDVGGAVSREDRGEALEQDIAKLLRHAFAADERVELVIGPREVAAHTFIEEVLEEGRIA